MTFLHVLCNPYMQLPVEATGCATLLYSATTQQKHTMTNCTEPLLCAQTNFSSLLKRLTAHKTDHA